MASVLYRTRNGRAFARLTLNGDTALLDATSGSEPGGLVLESQELNNTREMKVEDIKEIIGQSMFVKRGTTVIRTAGELDADLPARTIMLPREQATLTSDVVGTLHDVCFDLKDASVCFLVIKTQEQECIRVVVEDMREVSPASDTQATSGR